MDFLNKQWFKILLIVVGFSICYQCLYFLPTQQTREVAFSREEKCNQLGQEEPNADLQPSPTDGVLFKKYRYSSEYNTCIVFKKYEYIKDMLRIGEARDLINDRILASYVCSKDFPSGCDGGMNSYNEYIRLENASRLYGEDSVEKY